MTEYTLREDCAQIPWEEVARTLERVGMAHHAPEVHSKAFQHSPVVVFLFLGDRLIGFGRALTDFAYQAAFYDIAIQPEHQGQGLGRLIVERLLERTSGCNAILYAAPGKEGFYEKLGFRKMKTGLARFQSARAMKTFTEA